MLEKGLEEWFRDYCYKTTHGMPCWRLFRLNHEPSTVAGKKSALLHSCKASYTTTFQTPQSRGRERYRQTTDRSSQSHTMPEIFDDKSEHCIPFLLDRVKAHQARYGASDPKQAPPLFLGLNGVQGAGKTVLVGFPPVYVSCIVNYFWLSCR